MFAEQCWTNGKLFDSGYGYPAMKQSASSHVYGELYSVTDTELLRSRYLHRNPQNNIVVVINLKGSS
ncbi:gamma-glutamylcyclotransferase [Niallia sp. Krafla_26]|uniref:gamma-glutamylcyclotransferase n=1 Tax=Niallia sp. Krafla_26 TaxID=3064703 RepID=UPI003D17E993